MPFALPAGMTVLQSAVGLLPCRPLTGARCYARELVSATGCERMKHRIVCGANGTP